MNKGARELVIARAEQAESNAEDVFFDNCKFEGTREQRRIFQTGWRCGQEYGESLFLNPESFGVVYPPGQDPLINWSKLTEKEGLKKECGCIGKEPSGD
jgi:hypothetical protein